MFVLLGLYVACGDCFTIACVFGCLFKLDGLGV